MSAHDKFAGVVSAVLFVLAVLVLTSSGGCTPAQEATARSALDELRDSVPIAAQGVRNACAAAGQALIAARDAGRLTTDEAMAKRELVHTKCTDLGAGAKLLEEGVRELETVVR